MRESGRAAASPPLQPAVLVAARLKAAAWASQATHVGRACTRLAPAKLEATDCMV